MKTKKSSKSTPLIFVTIILSVIIGLFSRCEKTETPNDQNEKDTLSVDPPVVVDPDPEPEPSNNDTTVNYTIVELKEDRLINNGTILHKTGDAFGGYHEHEIGFGSGLPEHPFVARTYTKENDTLSPILTKFNIYWDFQFNKDEINRGYLNLTAVQHTSIVDMTLEINGDEENPIGVNDTVGVTKVVARSARTAPHEPGKIYSYWDYWTEDMSDWPTSSFQQQCEWTIEKTAQYFSQFDGVKITHYITNDSTVVVDPNKIDELKIDIDGVVNGQKIEGFPGEIGLRIEVEFNGALKEFHTTLTEEEMPEGATEPITVTYPPS